MRRSTHREHYFMNLAQTPHVCVANLLRPLRHRRQRCLSRTHTHKRGHRSPQSQLGLGPVAKLGHCSCVQDADIKLSGPTLVWAPPPAAARGGRAGRRVTKYSLKRIVVSVPPDWEVGERFLHDGGRRYASEVLHRCSRLVLRPQVGPYQEAAIHTVRPPPSSQFRPGDRPPRLQHSCVQAPRADRACSSGPATSQLSKLRTRVLAC